MTVGSQRERHGGPLCARRVDHGGYYALRVQSTGLPRTPQLVLDAAGRRVAAAGARLLVAEALRCLDRDEPFGLVPLEGLPGGRGLPCRVCEFRAVCRLEERPQPPEVATRLATLLTGEWRRGMR